MANNSNRISPVPLAVFIGLLAAYWAGLFFVSYRLAEEGSYLLALFFVCVLVLLAGGIRCLCIDLCVIVSDGRVNDE